MTYKITTAGQSRQLLERVNGPYRSETVALIDNSPKGWIARRAMRTERMSSMGPVFEPASEGVNVSRLVNQHNGGELIASALGIA